MLVACPPTDSQHKTQQSTPQYPPLLQAEQRQHTVLAALKNVGKLKLNLQQLFETIYMIKTQNIFKISILFVWWPIILCSGELHKCYSFDLLGLQSARRDGGKQRNMITDEIYHYTVPFSPLWRIVLLVNLSVSKFETPMFLLLFIIRKFESGNAQWCTLFLTYRIL